MTDELQKTYDQEHRSRKFWEREANTLRAEKDRLQERLAEAEKYARETNAYLHRREDEEAKTKADTLREAALMFSSRPGNSYSGVGVRGMLDARADQIEGEA